MSFLGPRESVFEFRAWNTRSVIYSFCSSKTCCESCVIISCFSFVMVMLFFFLDFCSIKSFEEVFVSVEDRLQNLGSS